MIDTSANNKVLSPAPKTRVCYVCGRSYGLNSYEIHLKQCKELWIAREELKDPRERRKLPEDPFANIVNKTGSIVDGGNFAATSPAKLNASDLEEINKIASSTFNTESLATCEFCGRSFLAEKLPIHNRSCTVENPARKVTDGVRRGAAPIEVSDLPNSKGLGKSLQPNPSLVANNSNGRLSDSLPARPKTSGSSSRVTFKPGLTEYQNVEPADYTTKDDVVNMKIENGSLVGNIGGSLGRNSRKQSIKPVESIISRTRDDSVNIDEDITIEFMSNKLESMERMAVNLMNSIEEMKLCMAKLKTTSKKSDQQDT
eukprot:gene12529-16805_t